MYYLAITRLGGNVAGQVDTREEALAIFARQHDATCIYVSEDEIDEVRNATLLARRQHIAFAAWKAEDARGIRQGGQAYYLSDQPSVTIGWPNMEKMRLVSLTHDLDQPSPMQQIQIHDAGRQIGRQIAQARNVMGLTQEELGTKMGYAASSAKVRVAELEKGKNMTLATMISVGNALGMGLSINWQKV